jgi:hypothetical protein
VSETRREALKILGTISATCAFPFAGDELYGQHVHPPAGQAVASAPNRPAFFTAGEYAALSRLADVIIPPTETPGAAAAGVPDYIDRVVSLNPEHQPLTRAGLAWLTQQARSRFSADYLSLDESQHAAILQPLSEALDAEAREQQQGRYRSERLGGRTYYVPVNDRTPLPRPTMAVVHEPGDPRLPVSFFRLIKNLTADGYYTSRIGLLEELGYAGNAVLSRFQRCAVPEQ